MSRCSGKWLATDLPIVAAPGTMERNRSGRVLYLVSLCVLVLLAAVAAPAADIPESPHGRQDIACTTCHSETEWTPLLDPLPFDHATTPFELRGSHQGTACRSCHPSLVFSEADLQCASCHQLDLESATEPDHTGFEPTCESCHDENDWRPSSFDHNQTGFVLQGAHRTADCASCHADGYAGTPTDCFSCHESDYAGASDPDHSGFPIACESCHGDNGWQPASFDHNQTGFLLQGAHRTADCASCHADGYAGTPTDCFSCHESDYAGASDPDHSGFPIACESCHGENGWQPANFDHNQTGFILQGAHRAADCASCHADGYAGTPTDCFSCHESDYAGASDPDHSGFPIACESCHGENGWQPATFDHNQTGFILQGAHRAADCASCHADGYAGTPTDCFSCHESDYAGASDPDHSGFPTTCENCHGENGWQPANFDHNQTGFILQGAHRAADCASCHADGYAGTPTDCFSCHESDYTGASDPDHSGFPTTCENCHGENGWQPANFDHNVTGFPLQGAHRAVACESCHADGYAGTPTDCFSCHESHYNAAQDPIHAGLPINCETCHGQVAWDPSNFSHNQTGFPLDGAHRQLDCVACHDDGYTGTPSDCYSCHQSDYNSTNNPDHASAGFPTSCESCHNTTDWNDADFNHDFPINSGSHRQAWNDCSDCHIAPGNFQVFSCIDCHEHNREDMEDKHDDVPGYVYQSASCYSCHPDGEE